MNASPGWRRFAVKLVRHTASVLPGASPWTQAMRRELDYIQDDRAALAWALGCVLASYKARLAALWHISGDRNSSDRNRKQRLTLSGARTREILRHAAAAGGALMLVGLALLENGGGQAAPAPSPPVLDETACDKADKAQAMGPDFDQNQARTLPSSAAPGRSTHEMSCADRQAPVRVLPKYVTP
jgi:hypothetical protein